MSHAEQLIVIFLACLCAVVVGFGFDWRLAPAGFVLGTAFFAWVVAPNKENFHE